MEQIRFTWKRIQGIVNFPIRCFSYTRFADCSKSFALIKIAAFTMIIWFYYDKIIRSCHLLTLVKARLRTIRYAYSLYKATLGYSSALCSQHSRVFVHNLRRIKKIRSNLINTMSQVNVKLSFPLSNAADMLHAYARLKHTGSPVDTTAACDMEYNCSADCVTLCNEGVAECWSRW